MFKRNAEQKKSWIELRKSILLKQSECVSCGSKDKLCIHHNSYKGEGKKNISVLCKKCHYMFHFHRRRLCQECRQNWHDIRFPYCYNCKTKIDQEIMAQS